jgi:hypothetical protein
MLFILAIAVVYDAVYYYMDLELEAQTGPVSCQLEWRRR